MNKYIDLMGALAKIVTPSSLGTGESAGVSGTAITVDPAVTTGPAITGGKPLMDFLTGKPLLVGGLFLGLVLLTVLVISFLRKKKTKERVPLETGVKTMKSAVNGPISVGNVQNIGQRESQQDSFGLSDMSNKALCEQKGLFAIVADGMGGLSNGAEVSALVTRSMLGSFSTRPFTADTPQELLNMLSYANKEVNGFLKNVKDRSGSTVVAVLLKDKMLHWISVGDSRICLIRNGAILQLNREHTYASELDEKAAKGEISYEKAQSDPQRNALTSYLGMGELEKIDRSLRPLQLTPGDRVLLMSDGVFGTLSDEEILSTMNLVPYESVALLEELILKKNKRGQDNFTAILIECH